MTKKIIEPSEYTRPPITEAVIEIVFAGEVKNDVVNKVSKKFKKYYTNDIPVTQYDVRVDVQPSTAGGATANLKKEKKGQRLSTSDETEILVIWPNSISVSQIAPYKGWDIFHKRFARDFKLLKKEVGIREIKRIGVRYINRIDIPAVEPIVEHEEYINIFPKLPDNLTPLTAYMVQAELQLLDVGANLRINSSAVPSPIADHASFVIDLDFYRIHDMPSSDKKLNEYLNLIREKKNEIFESLVKDKARGLFKNEK